MKVDIESLSFENSSYKRGKNEWKASTLYDYAKVKEYPVLDMPLWNIDLTRMPFCADTLQSFVYQCKRVFECSLDFPIILDDTGQIADGNHRLCKALIEGRESIKAIRLKSMPAPDYIYDEEE